MRRRELMMTLETIIDQSIVLLGFLFANDALKMVTDNRPGKWMFQQLVSKLSAREWVSQFSGIELGTVFLSSSSFSSSSSSKLIVALLWMGSRDTFHWYCSRCTWNMFFFFPACNCRDPSLLCKSPTELESKRTPLILDPLSLSPSTNNAFDLHPLLF